MSRNQAGNLSTRDRLGLIKEMSARSVTFVQRFRHVEVHDIRGKNEHEVVSVEATNPRVEILKSSAPLGG